MKALALLVLVGCSGAPSPNLAIAFVASVEPDAKCTAYFTDEGPTHTHSAVCKMPTKAVLYCSVSADKGPACQALNGEPPKPEAKP